MSGLPPATGPLPIGEVGYRDGNNVVLRTALYEVWRTTCHSCGRARLFAETQIDHLIPRTVDPATLQKLIDFHGLDADFHVDRPANLALICGRCNNRKRDRILMTTSLTVILDIARHRSAEVVRRVRAHATAREVARGLIAAVRADLRHPDVRREFLGHAPAVVQTLALLDEQRANFSVYRDFDVPLNGGDLVEVTFDLDTHARMRYGWVEEVCGRTWAEAIQAGLQEAVSRAAAVADQAIDDQCDTGSVETDATEPTSAAALRASMEISDLHLEGSRLSCELRGILSGVYDAVVTVADPDGPPLETTDLAVTVDLSIPFTLAVSWDLAEGRTGPITTTLSLSEPKAYATKRLAWI